jgi:ATP-dependent Clp protease protease subunit
MNDLEFLGFANDVSTLDPVMYQYFNQLLNKRTIILNSEIDESILETVVLPLKDFENDEDKSPITLILNTPGGSVADGLMLCNVIDNYKHPLEIIVPSYSCSMGTIILCSGNKNPNITKKAYPFSFALFHSGQTYVGGESTSVDDVIDFNRAVDNKIRDYVVKNTNISEELYAAHHRKQWYLTAEEMLEYGLIDEIIGA